MEKKTKYVLIGLGVVAVGTGAYFYFQHQKKKNKTDDFKKAFESNNIQLPESIAPSRPSKSSKNGSSGFPLKKGSRGTLVKNLQNALIKKYGSSILPRYGADGQFGSETQNALKSKGHPTVVDSQTFTQIVLGAGSSSTDSAPTSAISSASQISSMLHSAIDSDNFSKAIAALNNITSVSKYSEVNAIFKQTRVGLVRMTIVTALLEEFNASSQKKKLNEEFYRMGLKYNGSHWSLSGLNGAINQLVTIKPTKVWNSEGQSLQVPKATILGEYMDAVNGATEFITLDGKRLFAPTNAISYVS
ncbi:MAG: hypothetical protein COA32_13595 [Fluviicola sp.]|nr:MAG: hypothetical protein COA32_13595 [Fluviicola sp.]